jgi:hypothetical protein
VEGWGGGRPVRWVFNSAIFEDFKGEGEMGRHQFIRGSEEEATTLHLRSVGDEGEAGHSNARRCGTDRRQRRRWRPKEEEERGVGQIGP